MAEGNSQTYCPRAQSPIDFDPRSDQTKDYEIDLCCKACNMKEEE